MAKSLVNHSPFEELELFCLIAAYLKSNGRASFNDIAKGIADEAMKAQKVRPTESTISNCIKVMNLWYTGNEDATEDECLIYTRPRAWSELTLKGEVFTERASRFVRALGQPLATFVKVASSDMLDLVMSLAVAAWREKEGSETGLQFLGDLSFKRQQERVLSGKIDFAVTWSLRGYKAGTSNKLVYREFETGFPILLVCHPNHRFAQEYRNGSRGEGQAIDLRELAKETIYVLPDGTQPLQDNLPRAKASAPHISMKHFSSILNHIRYDPGGVALVPGLYPELDNYRKLGQLHYAPVKLKNDSLPELKVAALTRKNLSKPADSLLRCFEKALNGYLTKPAWDLVDVATQIPQGTVGYMDFSHCYYMRVDHTGLDAPHWCHATIKWKQPANTGVLNGHMKIRPQHCLKSEAEYTLTGEASNDIFYFRGDCRQDSLDDRFLAVFNISSSSGNILAGTWTGKDYGNKPSSGPMILSRKDLSSEPDTIRSVTRAAMSRHLANVDTPVNLVDVF